MNKAQVKGRVEQVKRRIKKVTLSVVGNKALEANGKAQMPLGKIAIPFKLLVGRDKSLASIFVVVLALVFGLTAINARAATPAFGGAYSLNDPGAPTGCNNVNLLTGTCSCPGGVAPSYNFRIINDAAGPGTSRGGHAVVCSSGAPLSTSEFAGGFQLDDPTPGNQGCRVSNATTGGCSCPTGTVAVGVRTLTDSAVGIVGSHIFLCMQQTASPASFGGAFQLDDPVPGGAGCRVSNPFTGGCACPAAFSAQPLRLQVDTPSGFRGSTLYTCVLPMGMVQLCANQYADSTGASSADAALQACIDATVTDGTLEIPAGTYRVDNQIQISRPITLRTKGTAGVAERCLGSTPCATLLAAPTFYVSGGILALRTTSNLPPLSNVHLDHLILDGNRSGRIGSPAHQQCVAGQNRWGFNAIASDCTNCSFTNSASVRALCGTGFEWTGDNATITNSEFNANGDHYTRNTWADGLTVLQSNGALITNNLFAENSDISLIIGGGQKAKVENNLIRQQQMNAFAGFMMDNFNGTTSGDFTGAVISGNTVICDRCNFGMNLGPHPWYLTRNIIGGEVKENIVRGGMIALNVDGAGSEKNPLVIIGNDLGPPRELVRAGCAYATRFSVSPRPDSWLTDNSTPPDFVQDVHNCFPSAP